MTKVVVDFGLCKSCVVRKLGSGVLTVPGTKYRTIIVIVVIDFDLCESCVVRKLGSAVLTVPDTKYRIIICVRSNGQDRH
jgi:hypothetical protein